MTTHRRRRPTSVRHWAEKKIVLMGLWHCATEFDIADHVYADDANMALRVQDNLKHWERHYPIREDGPGPRFFRDLAALLGLKSETGGRQVINCSLGEFVELIGDKADRCRALDQLRREVENGMVLASDVGDVLGAKGSESRPVGQRPAVSPNISAMMPALSVIYHNMMVGRRSYLPSIREAVGSGRLDQKHFYLTPDATEGWFSLIRAESYPTYDQCKAGLRRLVESPQWASAISKVAPATVVMLAGGGAPTKDLVVIHSLLKHPALQGRRIAYYLIDISPYMLHNAVWWLLDALANIEGGDRVDVRPVQDDVLDLSDLKSELIRGDGGVLFGITGGTIGNLSEDAFFRALNRVSRPGDLLFMSADTIPDAEAADGAAFEGRIVHKYDHPNVRRFIGPVVRSLAAELDLVHPVGSVFDAVDIGIDDGKLFSDVPNSLSLTMSMSSGERRINMLSSTRYRRPELRDFSNERGWAEISEFESPFNADYVQFFLERFG